MVAASNPSPRLTGVGTNRAPRAGRSGSAFCSACSRARRRGDVDDGNVTQCCDLRRSAARTSSQRARRRLGSPAIAPPAAMAARRVTSRCTSNRSLALWTRNIPSPRASTCAAPRACQWRMLSTVRRRRGWCGAGCVDALQLLAAAVLRVPSLRPISASNSSAWRCCAVRSASNSPPFAAGRHADNEALVVRISGETQRRQREQRREGTMPTPSTATRRLRRATRVAKSGDRHRHSFSFPHQWLAKRGDRGWRASTRGNDDALKPSPLSSTATRVDGATTATRSLPPATRHPGQTRAHRRRSIRHGADRADGVANRLPIRPMGPVPDRTARIVDDGAATRKLLGEQRPTASSRANQHMSSDYSTERRQARVYPPTIRSPGVSARDSTLCERAAPSQRRRRSTQAGTSLPASHRSDRVRIEPRDPDTKIAASKRSSRKR